MENFPEQGIRLTLFTTRNVHWDLDGHSPVGSSGEMSSVTKKTLLQTQVLAFSANEVSAKNKIEVWQLKTIQTLTFALLKKCSR